MYISITLEQARTQQTVERLKPVHGIPTLYLTIHSYNTAIFFTWFPLDSLSVYIDYIHGFFFYI